MDTLHRGAGSPRYSVGFELAEDVPDTTDDAVELLLRRRSIGECHAAGELCLALYFHVRAGGGSLDSGEFLAIYEWDATGAADDVRDVAVADCPDHDGRALEGYVAHVDYAVLVDVGELLEDGERVGRGARPVASVVRLQPAKEGDVGGREHGEAVEGAEVLSRQGDGEGDAFGLPLGGFPPEVGECELPGEVVKCGVEVVQRIPDPQTPIEQRRFFDHFDVEDVVARFRVQLMPDSWSADLDEGADFVVESLGMCLGLTDAGVTAVERIHRAAR